MAEEAVYPQSTDAIAERRKSLAPEIHDAFTAFSRAVFGEGHVTQCPYCIAGHTQLAHRKGASDEEIMEAIWVAAETRAGGAYAHSTIALHTLGGAAGPK